MPQMQDPGPLKLTVSYNWPHEVDKEAELYFTATPSLQMVEMLAVWGPGPRQQRAYSLGEMNLEELHEWLTKVLGYEK